MKISLGAGVFVRTIEDETMVWCPRTGACVIASNVSELLAEIVNGSRCAQEIISCFATKFGSMEDEARRDAQGVLEALKNQQLVVENDNLSLTKPTALLRKDDGFIKRETNSCEDDSQALEDFCTRHNLLSDLHIDLTDRCNERCVHCYIPKGGVTFLRKATAFKILREFREMQGLTVFFSGGECLLHPDFAVILSEARRLDLNIVVLSNLLACDEKVISFLKEIDPQFVNVSLYSMRATEHDAITRVSGSWDRTMNAISALKDAGVHIRIATPIMFKNKDSIDGLIAFAEMGNMHCVLNCDIVGRIDHDCSNQDHALSIDQIENVIRQHKTLLCRGKLECGECDSEAKVCDIGIGCLNVNAHGDYYPCDGFHGMVLGNAAYDSLKDVWNCDKLNKLRTLQNKDFPKCVECENRPWCKVCVMRNFNETGDMFIPAPERCAVTAVHRKIWEEK